MGTVHCVDLGEIEILDFSLAQSNPLEPVKKLMNLINHYLDKCDRTTSRKLNLKKLNLSMNLELKFKEIKYQNFRKIKINFEEYI